MTVAVALLVAGFFAAPTGWAQTSDDKEHAGLAKAQRGLTASAKEGKPISAKYEVERMATQERQAS